MLASNAWARSSVETIRSGNENYRHGQYDDAVKSYQQALVEGGQDNVARYNLGNALYRKGSSQAGINMDGAIADMEQSITVYEDVLKKNIKDNDARFNRDIVTKTIEKLKKQKKEQQQKQDQNNKQEKDKNKDQTKDHSKEQQGKDKQKSDQQDQGQDKEKDQQQAQDKDKQHDKKDGSKKDQEQIQQKKDEGKKDPSKNKLADGQMTKEEAKDILEDYQRNEEPKGLLNFIEKTKGDEQPVSKDW